MRSLFNGFNMSIGMFTVIPPFKKVWEEKSGRHMMKIFPFIGIILGIIWFIIAFVLSKVHINHMLKAAIVLAIPFFLTGFLHLDGFMDVCDAILSRRDKEEKLRILKDSKVGAFSVISLMFLLIIEFSSIYGIDLNSKKIFFFIIIQGISRALVGYFLITREPINESYFAKLYKEGTGIVDKIVLIGVLAVGIILSFFVLGIKGIIVPIAMIILGLILLLKTKREFGGINGDVSGYIITLIECLGIIILSII